MKHLELHILQSVPVSCLNRDDLGSPKTAIFGGSQRARVSSQSWKRAIREEAQRLLPHYFQGKRTRYISIPLLNELKVLGIEENKAQQATKDIVDALVKKEDKKSKENTDNEPLRSKTVYFMSPNEIKLIAKQFKDSDDPKKAIKNIKGNALVDAADISLFGRMVANDNSLNIDAASMFSHALSVHESKNDIDFFVTVDDSKPSDAADAGSSMMGTLDFNSATYYRFAAVNLDMLSDNDHLGALTLDERKSIIKAFVEATLRGIPGARKNTMNANTFPSYVLGVIRETGHPIQLINAFESPIHAHNGYIKEAIKALEEEYDRLKNTWNLEATLEKRIPEQPLAEFLTDISNHVI